jgi:phage terminase large subunit GpA-like protein
LLVGVVDTQRAGEGRLELDIWAFGSKRRRAFVQHIDIEGSTSDKETWAKLDAQTAKEWTTADGRRLRLGRVGIDSGDGKVTMQVYAWARRHPGFVMTLKGRHELAAMQPIAGPTWMDVTISGRKIQKGVKLWTVGTSMLKLELYGDLQLEKPVDGEEYPEGYVYLPEGMTDEEIKQLVAEQFVSVQHRGKRSTSEWRKLRDRNERLDLAVYARAVALAMGVDRWTESQWRQLTEKPALKPAKAAAPDPKKPPPRPAPPVRAAPKPAANWLNRRGR